jgi:histidinol-phosphate/aromatic aminotransferase/cobyric acid decarboxylase-like protein
VARRSRTAARYHGDQAAEPGMLDFAVNMRAAEPPSWLVDRLTARLTDLGRYPSAADERRAVTAVAARHGRSADDVALLAGGAEGFTLLANLRPRLAALIAPWFTEPEAALAAAGVPFRHVVLAPPFGLAGARVPDLLDQMTARRPHWPLGTLQLEAVAACSSPTAEADRGAHRLAALRTAMVGGLTSIGLDVIDGCAPFVLFTVPDAELMRKHLDGKGIAVRRCDTFVGLDGEYLRAAVRPHWPVLVDAIAEFTPMSRLREERMAP